MKKNSFVLIIFLLIGLLTGSIISQLLEPVPALFFLTKSSHITWQPSADLGFLSYDFDFQVKLNIANILGLVFAFWLYRKL
ncbi:DUF4321 domain-containing protein [Chengkuizengella axinellae]|uniref:DUF4321 domain-containing protein n=1 Tax=Chengkuizengella axinellae TaxID=3064388 RepID=A0ABT9ITP3_9BACL|nr:DUF4321 domain-containing protein [Chengkuizengella sp. 2205SS18-9]MDP5272724.1 DUF4321 domain-containing protein [Chengkuizengella sp. 2205SS18-9]